MKDLKAGKPCNLEHNFGLFLISIINCDLPGKLQIVLGSHAWNIAGRASDAMSKTILKKPLKTRPASPNLLIICSNREI
jgi:hypothetical protein